MWIAGNFQAVSIQFAAITFIYQYAAFKTRKKVYIRFFDKVFRGVCQKEIEGFDEKEITNEYKRLFEESGKEILPNIIDFHISNFTRLEGGGCMIIRLQPITP